MPSSRASILASLRRSLAQPGYLPSAPAVTLPPPDGGRDAVQLANRFGDELSALGGHFREVPAANAAAEVLALVRAHDAWEILAWDQSSLPVPGLLEALRAAGVDVLPVDLPRSEPERALALARLETCRVGLTGVDAALADTGTLALRSGPGQPRLASLSVQVHIALLTPSQLWPSWAAWLAAGAAPPTQGASSSLTLITGPSRTGDIEMTLTIGVHGPAVLYALLVAE
jgi:L-lactate dehydrogenase complex protein LldG